MGAERRSRESHEEGGKAFRSLSAPPSRMPGRVYVWLLDPTVYIYILECTHAHKRWLVRVNSSFLGGECANAHLLAAYIRYVHARLLLIAKYYSRKLASHIYRTIYRIV